MCQFERSASADMIWVEDGLPRRAIVEGARRRVGPGGCRAGVGRGVVRECATLVLGSGMLVE